MLVLRRVTSPCLLREKLADYAAERGFDTSRVTGDKKKEKDK